ncbi:hypothetical protein G6514_001718 [Epicoccum nigrum]|nr:hypothetical protein G6514_001718 [Epicoccum nigrum]
MAEPTLDGAPQVAEPSPTSITNGVQAAETADVTMIDSTETPPDTLTAVAPEVLPDAQPGPPAQQPEPQTESQPTPTPAPASAPTPSPAPAATAPASSRNSPHPQQQAPTQPIPHGSPTRVYLNQNVTPHLLEAMKHLATNEPEKPLKFLSEFLANKSREIEG